MMRGSAFIAAALITMLASQDQARSSPHDGDHDDGWHGWNGGTHRAGWHQPFAAVIELASKSSLLQTGDTAWTLTKTATVDSTAKTVTWNIAATKNAVTGGRLVVDGFLDVINLGTGPATLGNIVVNLQAKQGSHWVTVSSDVADATQGDNATTAHVVGEDTIEGQDTFSENAASGPLSFLDRRYNTIFSLVPEMVLTPGSHLPLLYSASFDNNVLHLADNADVRFEVIITFGNHPLGGPQHTDENVDINGNGIIDADEHKVRSIADVFKQRVPAQQTANATLALSDAAADVSAQGTVTYTAPVVNLNATTGTVKINYDAGTNGGTITNCVHGTGTGITDPVGSFTFTAVMPVSLTTCTTATIEAPPVCIPGAPGCGWHDGDEISYSQNTWGAKPPSGPPASLVTAQAANQLPGTTNFDLIYPSTMVLGGAGFHLVLDSGEELLSYLPQSGPPGALNNNILDPGVGTGQSTTSSGVFGGQVAALYLNIDFADANLTHGTAATAYGDLRLCGLTGATAALDGSTIRQLRPIMDNALGGSPSAYSIADLSALLMLVNGAFEGGFVTTFAQGHVVNGTCP
ncbi:hypothetical protein BH11MYX1_BH11MYX1_17100 [soil metagenome]